MQKKTLSRKNKETVGWMLILAFVTVLIIIGGINERGYYWPAGELVLIPVALLGIAERRKTYE